MFNFFATKSFGLDISDFSAEALELSKSFTGGYKVSSYARIKLEPGLVENGRILKLAKLVDRIQELLTKAQPRPIKSKHVSLSLPESRVFTSVINLPAKLNEEEIKEAVENQIPEIFPLEPETTSSAWQILKQDAAEKEILVAAIDNKLLNQYYELISQLNLKVNSLEMESTAAARAVIPDIKNNEGVLLLDFGARTTTISIFDNKGLFTTYNINIAGQHFTQAIADKLKISIAEAEKRKIKSGLSHPHEGQILLIIQALLQEILVEIKKSVDFFVAKTNRSINRAYLVGGSALLPSLPEYLTQNLKIKVEIGDPFTKIANYDIIKAPSVLFTNVIGLALKGLDKKKKEYNSINFAK